MVEDPRSVHNLPAEILVIHVSHKQRLGSEGVWLNIDVSSRYLSIITIKYYCQELNHHFLTVIHLQLVQSLSCTQPHIIYINFKVGLILGCLAIRIVLAVLSGEAGPYRRQSPKKFMV